MIQKIYGSKLDFDPYFNIEMLYRSKCHFRHGNERIGIVSFSLSSFRLQGFAAQKVVQSNSNLIFCAVHGELFHFCQYNYK